MTDKIPPDDIDIVSAICKSLPPEIARKALFYAVTSLALTSHGEVPPPPTSSPSDVLIGLLGAMGIGVAATVIERATGDVVKEFGDHEAAAKIAAEAIAKATKH